MTDKKGDILEGLTEDQKVTAYYGACDITGTIPHDNENVKDKLQLTTAQRFMLSRRTELSVITPQFVMIKSCTFLSPDKDGWICQIGFNAEDFNLSSEKYPYPRYLRLFVIFTKDDTNRTLRLEIQDPSLGGLDGYYYRRLNFINFEQAATMYTAEMQYVATILGTDLYLRAKSHIPYQDANFKEITLSFFVGYDGEKHE